MSSNRLLGLNSGVYANLNLPALRVTASIPFGSVFASPILNPGFFNFTMMHCRHCQIITPACSSGVLPKKRQNFSLSYKVICRIPLDKLLPGVRFLLIRLLVYGTGTHYTKAFLHANYVCGLRSHSNFGLYNALTN